MIKSLIDFKKVKYYYIFTSTENINNMKDLMKEEKRIEGLNRLTLASHISMEKIMLRNT